MSKDWVDVLMPRRVSSDFLWISLHDWNCDKYKHSKNRTYEQIRDDVYKEAYIKTLLQTSPHLRPRIDRILDEMSHTWSLRAIRFIGYFLTKIMKSIYQHVYVDDYIKIDASSIYSSLECDRNVHDVINSLSKSAPILYMPTHRSYADFLLLSYICFHFNLPLPAIAAGIDFLSLNQIASLLRACGAYYIRRSFKNNNDNLYWHVFRAYVQTQLRGGERPMEFFIEGTRSRNGKSLYPRTGLLSVALELFLTAQIPDLIIIPISMSYDRTLEERLYAKELWPFDSTNGGKKPPETTKHLLSGAKAILEQDHGSVFIRFCEPISVRDLCQKYDFRMLHTLDSQCDPNRIQTNEELNFIMSLSKMIINRQQSNFVFSPFTLSALSLSSHILKDKSNIEMSFIQIPFNHILEDVSALSELISEQNLSHSVIENESLVNALLNSFKVHSNIVSLSHDPIIVHFDAGNALNIVQLQQYANQPLQLLIDLAIYLYVNGDYLKFSRLKWILSREFIYEHNEMDQYFFDAQIKSNNVNDNIKRILCLQIHNYVDNYLTVAKWLLNVKQFSGQLKLNDIRQLIKDIQKDVLLSSDIIQNAFNIILSNNSLSNYVLDHNSFITPFINELNDMSENSAYEIQLIHAKYKANL